MMKPQDRIAIIIILVLFVQLLSGCSTQQTDAEAAAITRTVSDMAGRTVEIPALVNKVYATGTIGSILLYTLAPEKLAGWNSALSDTEKVYIDSKYHYLPVLGSWKGTKLKGNIEELLKTEPDLIINVGDVSEAYISDANAIAQQLHIPVIMVDGRLEKTADAYEFLGDILNVSERAKKLAEYSSQALSEVRGAVGNIPENERVSYYYAEGVKGLETETGNTLNTEALSLAGAVNVADKALDKSSRRIQVSLEQILDWDADLIIISADGDGRHQLYNEITSGSWRNIEAVKNGMVYEIPFAPYDWLNRPPSANRLIGIKWLANLLYPDVYEINMRKEIQSYFMQFYSYEFSDEDMNVLLKLSERK